MCESMTALTTRRPDGRSAVAVAVRKWKAQVTADLGGSLSEAQETILEGAAQKLIIRDSLAAYIARQGSLVSKKRSSPWVKVKNRDYSQGEGRHDFFNARRSFRSA